jgi:hypothetical protein
MNAQWWVLQGATHVQPWHLAYMDGPLYLVVQLPLLLLFRFVVLVTVHPYDPL